MYPCLVAWGIFNVFIFNLINLQILLIVKCCPCCQGEGKEIFRQLIDKMSAIKEAICFRKEGKDVRHFGGVTSPHSFLIHQFLCLPYLHKPLLHKSPYCLLPPTAINCRTYPLLAVDSPCCPILEVGKIREQVTQLYHLVSLHKFSKNYPLHSMLNSLLCNWQCHCMMVLSVGQIFE